MPRDERPGKKPYGSRGRRPRGSLRRIPCVVETNGEPAMKKRAFLYLSSGAQKPTGLKTSPSMVPRAARKGKYPELRVFTDYDLRSSAREALGSGRARAARDLRRTEKSEPRKRLRARPASFKIGFEPRKFPKKMPANLSAGSRAQQVKVSGFLTERPCAGVKRESGTPETSDGGFRWTPGED